MSLPVINPQAAGLDVGSEKIHASIAGAQAKVFGACTADLHALRDWLKEGGVTSVAMEATGIYWLGVYAVLEAAGMEVIVVNGAHVERGEDVKTAVISACRECSLLAGQNNSSGSRHRFCLPVIDENPEIKSFCVMPR